MKRIPTLFLSFLLLIGFQSLYQSAQAGGGPDAFGYTWLDSNDPGGPSYTWIDTNANWVQMTGLADDNSVGMFNMFFDFQFYWGQVNSFKCGSNGWLSFDNVSNIAHCFPAIPTAGGAGDHFVAPLMSDLTFSTNSTPNPGQVWYWTNLKDSLVVSYYNVPFWTNGTPNWTGSNTFQVLLDATDSSITYNYRAMTTTFNNTAGCNQDNVIGIENSTGAIGLQCWNDFVPASLYSIRFEYPDSVLINVQDLTPAWNQNLENGGEFRPAGLIATLNSNIANVGNTDVLSSSTVTARIQNLALVTQYTSTQTLPQLLTGDDTTMVFTPQANLATPGQYYYEVDVNNSSDINPGNDVNTTEINMVDLTGSSAMLSYATGGPNTGSITWSGGSTDDGVGIYIEPPTYPCTIDSIEYYLAAIGLDSMIASIYDDNGMNGGPGTLLWTTNIPNNQLTAASWNMVPVTSTVTINSGGFYIAWFQGGAAISIGHETAGPKSRRGFEILSGQWAEYRENTVNEFMINTYIGNFPCAVQAGFTETSVNTVVTFTNASVGGTSYLWDFGDGNTSTQTSPVHTYASTGTYTVCLTTTSSCGSDSVCQQVTVNCAAPTSGFTSTSNGISVQFNDASSGAGINNWLWDFGDGNTSTQQNPFHSYAAPGNYTVCLTISSPCGTDSSCQNITVCALPTTNWNFSTNGLTTTFANFTSGATSFLWDLGDGNTSTLQNPMHTYAAAGTYTVCLIATNACASDTLCQPVTVCAPPQAAWTSAQTASLTMDFTDQTPGQPTGWLWDFGDGNTSTQQSPQHVYSAPGMYTVCLIVTDACASDTSCQTISVTLVGLESGLPGFAMQAFPNPASQALQVNITVPDLREVSLHLRDIAGREIRRIDLGTFSGQMSRTLDVAELAQGMYFLEVRAGDFSITQKVLKE